MKNEIFLENIKTELRQQTLATMQIIEDYDENYNIYSHQVEFYDKLINNYYTKLSGSTIRRVALQIGYHRGLYNAKKIMKKYSSLIKSEFTDKLNDQITWVVYQKKCGNDPNIELICDFCDNIYEDFMKLMYIYTN